MEQVKVRKSDLLDVIRRNRQNHGAQWKDAFDGYRRAMIEALRTNLEAFERGEVTRVSLVEYPPEDHTRDYDRVLRMLEMSVEDEVTLQEESFQQYVMDDWKWKSAWTTVNSKYLSR